MVFERANVRWFLSLNPEDLPLEVKAVNKRTYRSIIIGDEELEFSGGFADLHTRSYEKILDGNGFGIEDTRQAINIVHDIREKKAVGLKGEYHPLVKRAN